MVKFVSRAKHHNDMLLIPKTIHLYQWTESLYFRFCYQQQQQSKQQNRSRYIQRMAIQRISQLKKMQTIIVLVFTFSLLEHWIFCFPSGLCINCAQKTIYVYKNTFKSYQYKPIVSGFYFFSSSSSPLNSVYCVCLHF